MTKERIVAQRGEALKWLDELKNLDYSNGCILWPFATDKKSGYGIVIYHKRTRTAHRVALILHTGIDPVDLQACHGTCHDRKCCNPLHLSWKTITENHRDKIRDNTHNRGSRHYLSKLTEEDVRKIRKDDRIQREIAADYGVNRSVIASVKLGTYWKWVTQ